MPTLSTKRFAQRANAGRRVRRRLNVPKSMPIANKAELKYNTNETLGGAFPDLDGYPLLQIGKGTGRDERVGDTIRVKRIEVSLPSLEGNCIKAYLYSRDGAKGIPLGITEDVQEPDNTRYRIWNYKNQKKSLNNLSDVVGTNHGPSMTLSTNFSIPMKVTYDEDTATDTLSNGMYLAFYAVPFDGNTATAVTPQTIGSNFAVRIWYYDA